MALGIGMEQRTGNEVETALGRGQRARRAGGKRDRRARGWASHDHLDPVPNTQRQKPSSPTLSIIYLVTFTTLCTNKSQPHENMNMIHIFHS